MQENKNCLTSESKGVYGNRSLYFRNLPPEFTLSDLSKIVRTRDCIEHMHLMNSKPGPVSATVRFSTIEDATRYMQWAKSGPIWIRNYRVSVEYNIKPHSSRCELSKDTTRVVVVAPKVSNTPLSRDYVVNLVKRRYSGLFSLESSTKQRDGSRRIVFGNVQVASVVRAALAVEGWKVKFGKEECQSELPTVRTFS